MMPISCLKLLQFVQRLCRTDALIVAMSGQPESFNVEGLKKPQHLAMRVLHNCPRDIMCRVSEQVLHSQ